MQMLILLTSVHQFLELGGFRTTGVLQSCNFSLKSAGVSEQSCCIYLNHDYQADIKHLNTLTSHAEPNFPQFLDKTWSSFLKDAHEAVNKELLAGDLHREQRDQAGVIK